MIPLRDDTRRTGTPVINLLLIAANAALFFYELSLGPRLVSGVASIGVPNAETGGGVAFFAHIGGFVAGPVLLLLLGGGRRPARRQESVF